MRTVIITQQQMSVGLNIDQLCHKCSLLICVWMEAFATIEMRQISGFHILRHILFKTGKDIPQQLFAICIFGMYLFQGYRIWRVTEKLLLINVQPNTDDAVLDAAALQPQYR